MDTCIFCGEAFGPERPRSEEHATPRWCKDLVPDYGKAQHELVVETSAGVNVIDYGLRNPFTTVAEDVCRPCNNGWMHEMEESCRGILSHFIQGHSRNARYWRQTLVATWALKTALVWEFVAPEHHTVPFEVPQTLYSTQRLNLRQQVWMGQYSGVDPHSFRRAAAHVAGPVSGGSDNPQDAHAYAIAITVGQLAFVTFGHLLGVPFTYNLPEEFSTKLAPIWPPALEVLKWPFAETLDDAALEQPLRSLGLPIALPPDR